MTNEVILTAILPVAQEIHTALFALSTPQDYGHPTVQLFNTKDDEGKTIFRIVRIGKGCDECQAKQIMCPHADSVVSEGISSDKQNQFACFYRDDPELRLQEYGGIVSNSTRYSFHPDYVRLLALRKHYPVRGPIDMIMVTIDPAGGGKNEWAFCACYYDTTINMQIIIQTDGLCMRDTSPPEISDWLRRSIEHLRSRDEAFMDPPILIACENAPLNTGNNVAFYIQYHVSTGTLQNVFVMYEFGSDKGPGVGKDKYNTEDMTRYAAMLLTSEQVCFSERYSSCSPNISVQTAKTKFITQLTQFKPHLVRVTEDGQHIYKIHGKAGGRNDDQAVAYIMQYYWYKMAMASANPMYARVREYASSWRVGYVKIIPSGQSEQQKRIRDEVLENPHTKKRYDPVGYQNFDRSDDEIALPDDLLF